MSSNNDLTLRPPSTALATTGDRRNVFEVLADAFGGNKITGELLKFAKGMWTAGQNDHEMPVGTKLIAAMSEARVGWVKWRDKKVVDTRMVLAIGGCLPERREDLGDHDTAQWERNDKGIPQNPWSETTSLIFKAPGGGLYTWNATSRGGHNAFFALCRLYGRHLRTRDDQLPIISLEADHYKHAEYGRVFVPVLRFAGWTDAGEVLEALDLPRPERRQPEAPDFAQELDDDVPF